MSVAAQRDFDVRIQADGEAWRLAEAALRRLAGRGPTPVRCWQPAVDLYETDIALMVKVEVAGTREGHIRVSLSPEGDCLTVSGERHEPADANSDRTKCYQLEIFFGPFEREVLLPAQVPIVRDDATARYCDGILVITLPKRRPTAKEPRMVTVE